MWQSRVEIEHYILIGSLFKVLVVQNICKGWGSYMHCINVYLSDIHIYIYAARIRSVLLTEVLCYSASNVVMQLNYATK